MSFWSKDRYEWEDDEENSDKGSSGSDSDDPVAYNLAYLNSIMPRPSKITTETDFYHPTGKLILQADKQTGKSLVVVHKDIEEKLKHHQVDALKFMYNACFRSKNSEEGDEDEGCILAHHCGSGKTLTALAFSHTLLFSYFTEVKNILIVCPKNMTNHWIAENTKWIQNLLSTCYYKPRLYNADDYKGKTKNLKKVLVVWKVTGGMLLIDYETLEDLIKVSETSKCYFQELCRDVLVKPGPDVIICDEGHLMFNQNTAVSTYLNKVETKRRIVLTNTPLERSPLEYFQILNFVKSKIQGEYFQSIEADVSVNSTPKDIALRNAKIQLLNIFLKGVIHRSNADVLAAELRNSWVYTIHLPMTDVQLELYNRYIGILQSESTVDMLASYCQVQHILAHPSILEELESELVEIDVVNDEPDEKSYMCQSNKLRFVFAMIEVCEKLGDKLIVCSQSSATLDILEKFLVPLTPKARAELARFTVFKEIWMRGHDYLRIDGGTKADVIEEFTKRFNDTKNKRARLVLLSSEVCGGINLNAANRIVLLDTFWDPWNEVQCINRIFRLGQKKNCLFFRLVGAGTVEAKVCSEQHLKKNFANSVIDNGKSKIMGNNAVVRELFNYDKDNTDDLPQSSPLSNDHYDLQLKKLLHSYDIEAVKCVKSPIARAIR